MKVTKAQLMQIIQEELEQLLDDEGLQEDEKWIQGAEKDIEKRGTEGVCTGDKFGGPVVGNALGDIGQHFGSEAGEYVGGEIEHVIKNDL